MKIQMTYVRNQVATREVTVPDDASKEEINNLLDNLPLQWEGKVRKAKQVTLTDDGEIISVLMEI
jgi:uncharacterized protein YabE (DUF348 family)